MFNEEIKKFILQQIVFYPEMEIGDMLKALHQSEFGCGHFVGERAGEYLEEELSALVHTEGEAVESLGSDFARIHLCALAQKGLSKETLLRIFAISGSCEYGSVEGIEAKLSVLTELARSGQLPFSDSETECAVNQWRESGYPMCRHTENFREKYHPAYRVVRNDYAKYIDLFAAIDKLMQTKPQSIVALEGGSASGKSTLGDMLSKVYDCNLFHMDDFFLRPEQRTTERFAEIGGNVDYERFNEEVLLPLWRGEGVDYRRYNCSTQLVERAERFQPKALNIVEGAYSLHPQLRDKYDLRVFLKITPQLQRTRIEKRNPPFLQKRFFEEWIPLENTYFDSTHPWEMCDLVFSEC